MQELSRVLLLLLNNRVEFLRALLVAAFSNTVGGGGALELLIPGLGQITEPVHVRSQRHRACLLATDLLSLSLGLSAC